MNAPLAIEFVNVHYRTAANRELLSDLNLTVTHGEILILLGPSGSGKTTTLKLVNRMLDPTEGQVRVEGRSTLEWDVVSLRRRIGYAIQEGGLFPHYTVFDNVALVPRLEKWEAARLRGRVAEVMKMVGMPGEEFAGRFPDELSGGQRQRVGLARALAADPPMLLMDEPFGALDPTTRAGLQREFKELQHRLQKTVIFVTHDVSEALLLASRIGVVEGGRLRGLYTREEFLMSGDSAVRPYLEAIKTIQASLAV
ncbi:MAG TPA: ATP-binding cassette domain-containing protein [Candidatus Angelobacter sp.]|jgi:osmoprotectant transport system ATP-binding protein|nr:ATP-binding cassette domain-containing protein [Candidatus Angelobacter sp.]